MRNPAEDRTSRADPDPASEYASKTDRFRRAAVEQHWGGREVGPVVDSSWLPRLPRLRVLIRRPRAAARPSFRPRRRVPVRIQSQTTDCGPACLAMVLAYHGIDVGIDRLREEMNAGRDGVSVRVMLETCRRYGVPGRGVRVTIDDLRRISPASILFWNFRHFVVLERATGRHVDVVDPASGRRRIPVASVNTAFTGVAVEFQPPLASSPARQASLRDRMAASSWRYLGKFFPRDRSWLPLVLTSLFLLLFNFATPFASDYVVDHSQAGRGQAPGLLTLLTVIVVLVAVFFALQTARTLAISALQTVADKRVTLGVLHHLLSLPYDFFARRSAGDLAMRVRTSLYVRRILTGSALSTVFDGLLILAYLALLILADLKLAVFVIALAVLQVAILVLSWRHQHHLMANTLDCQSQSESELAELLDGIATLKSAGLDGTAGERWSHTFAEEVNARVRSNRYLALTSGISSGVQFAAPLGVLVLGLIQVTQRDASLGKVVGFSALAMGMFVPLSNLVLTGMQVAGLGRAFTRLGDILEATPESHRHVLPVRKICGAVELHDVSFSYPGTDRQVLCGVNLSARPGSFVAVLGRSGCGKTTLAAILAGLYTPTAGCALIDDMAISQLDRAALRRSISFVNQDSRLFAGSIRENIAIGQRNANYDDVVAAAKLAQIHEDIRALPMHYDTLLGPGGIGMSGGQLQRIALARALIRHPRLLILDEATSALDRRTEEQILARILGLHCTLIVIAHRLPSASCADEIIVIDHGAVAERGTHEQLLRGGGLYGALAAGGP